MRTRPRSLASSLASASCAGRAGPPSTTPSRVLRGVPRAAVAGSVIPAGVRFQVCLPFPASALNAFKSDFAHGPPIAARGFAEDKASRGTGRGSPLRSRRDVALRWDLAYETQDLERVLAWTPEGAWERFAGPVTRLTRLIPSEALVGYHLCYGTFPEWPMYEARDMDLLVRMANFAVANSGRTVDWLHLAGPRYLRSEDRSFFRPLVDLEPLDARVFLGIVLPIDGEAGLRRRVDTASRYISDFGVAMYCGFGRQPGKDGTETMREHAEGSPRGARCRVRRRNHGEWPRAEFRVRHCPQARGRRPGTGAARRRPVPGHDRDQRLPPASCLR